MWLFLYIVSYFIELPVFLINFFTVLVVKKQTKGYFRQGALERDKFGNRNYRTGLNYHLLKDSRFHPFGNQNETISEVLGWNILLDNLTKRGKFVVWCLNIIEKDHCLKAINK